MSGTLELQIGIPDLERVSKWRTNNPGQNICNKIGKSSKTGQDKKILISTFACFLSATAKV